ncbi:AraC family transcriptional regulator [Paenibacillus planticolens]|uniref:Helix-turn-helix domain-containing protein n=1 Tax=Paenibacillus planticolens TaxID=2654976 RepID=A0ABX1ZUN8_9BACL|nr:AraC family transcriptional regulator [Paenibacillus planticolens]NOV03759.1 helix-turn-helix domain-containing protein [Paenibacillus planticolens]
MDNEFEIITHPKIKHLNPFLVDLSYRNSHLHNDFEICLLLDGNLTVYSKKEMYQVSKNSIILFNPIQPHELHAHHGNALLLSIQISNRFCHSYFPAMTNIAFDSVFISALLSKEEHQLLTSILLEIAISYLHQDFGYELMCLSSLNRLFYHLLKCAPYHMISDEERIKNTNRLHRMNRILSYIDENFSSKLLLSSIAERENLSLPYLSHFFKENLNTTFQDYLNQVRFEKAKKLITQTDKKLIDICLESGFSDTRYLNKMFMKQFGCTPKQFLNQKDRTNSQSTNTNLKSIQKFYTDSESLEILNKYQNRGD